MENFSNNIVSIYGSKGKAWLDKLPTLIKQTSEKLRLVNLEVVPNLTFNYVLSGQKDGTPIILKLGLDVKALKQEASALKEFDGVGSAKLIHEDDGLILLQKVTPGTSLKIFFPNRDKEAISIASKIINQIHNTKVSHKFNYPHIREWLRAIDGENYNIPNIYIHLAKKMRDELLNTMVSEILLHGDLHHDNILFNGNEWLAIDPKGVIGESAFEVGAFIRNPISELLLKPNIKEIIKERARIFSTYLGIPEKRILQWCFVQSVLCWIWAIQDNLKADKWKNFTEVCFEIYNS